MANFRLIVGMYVEVGESLTSIDGNTTLIKGETYQFLGRDRWTGLVSFTGVRGLFSGKLLGRHIKPAEHKEIT